MTADYFSVNQIEFNGVFQGSLTYNNVHIKATFTYNYITDHDDIKFEVLGGETYFLSKKLWIFEILRY